MLSPNEVVISIYLYSCYLWCLEKIRSC